MYDTLILGGGLAGMALAALVHGRSVVLEKEAVAGGLCRSHWLNGIVYDLGPHIIFSKNQEILRRHCEMVPTERIRRQNNVLISGRWVKYPFENDLSSLAPEDCERCLREFLHNPYEHYAPQNMEQFFLRTFGEGITQLYLRPYNEKIWKFNPACLDLQMVERIPKPPAEDVIKSAQGEQTEGYMHQLYFHYPREGGIQSLFDAYHRLAGERADLRCNSQIQRVERIDGAASGWRVITNHGEFTAPRIVNCMPLHELVKVWDAPSEIRRLVEERLLYNSIHIVVLQVRQDAIGDRFAVYVPDADILFHRLSKLNFLGESYCLPDGGSTLMAEVTFRPGSALAEMTTSEVQRRVIADLMKLKLIDSADSVTAIETQTSRYAYVIYDLDHRRNVDTVLNCLRSHGIQSVGRFAEFEYVNTDQVVERVMKLADRLNGVASS